MSGIFRNRPKLRSGIFCRAIQKGYRYVADLTKNEYIFLKIEKALLFAMSIELENHSTGMFNRLEWGMKEGKYKGVECLFLSKEDESDYVYVCFKTEEEVKKCYGAIDREGIIGL